MVDIREVQEVPVVVPREIELLVRKTSIQSGVPLSEVSERPRTQEPDYKKLIGRKLRKLSSARTLVEILEQQDKDPETPIKYVIQVDIVFNTFTVIEIKQPVRVTKVCGNGQLLVNAMEGSVSIQSVRLIV